MKQNIFTSLLLLLSITATAQNKKQTITITTKLGEVHTYVMGETIDSTRVIEGVGIKVYPKGKTVSEDFLFSQIDYTITETVTPNPEPIGNNSNRNTADDLKKNREGWRLEFPRFYQGTLENCVTTLSNGTLNSKQTVGPAMNYMTFSCRRT